jgi:hypothetical protein
LLLSPSSIHRTALAHDFLRFFGRSKNKSSQPVHVLHYIDFTYVVLEKKLDAPILTMQTAPDMQDNVSDSSFL